MLLRTFALLALLGLLGSAHAATLEWDRNIEPEVAGYRTYQGMASRSYSVVTDVGNNTSATLPSLVTGATYYFAVTAYTADGLESDFSEEVSYTVPSSNSAPIATADSYTTVKATALSVSAANGVLNNDTDANGDALTALLVSNPANGSLSLNANGSFTYTPASTFVGTDTFSYRASDGQAASAIAVVTITVTAPPNSPPVASADTYSTTQGARLDVTAASGVLANDVDAENDVLTALLAGAPANGSLALAPNGGFSYTPNAAFVGVDVFGYRVTDGKATSAVATVTITVAGISNREPVAVEDAYGTPRKTVLVVAVSSGVLANDLDADGDDLTALLAVSPVRGKLSLSTNGSFTYTPNGASTGKDSFSYRATDGKSTSAVCVVTIFVGQQAASSASLATAPIASDLIPADSSIESAVSGELDGLSVVLALRQDGKRQTRIARFDRNTFTTETLDGTIVESGTYAFTRRSATKALLVLTTTSGLGEEYTVTMGTRRWRAKRTPN